MICKTLALFVLVPLSATRRAIRLHSGLAGERRAQSLIESNLAAEPVRCPVGEGTSQTKNYFFDLPGETVADSTAVHLIRDPQGPKLVIYKGAVWRIWQKNSPEGNLIGNVHFEATTTPESGYDQAMKAEFDLRKDTISIKRVVEDGVAAFEYDHEKCNGPIRPTRFGLLEVNSTSQADAVAASSSRKGSGKDKRKGAGKSTDKGESKRDGASKPSARPGSAPTDTQRSPLGKMKGKPESKGLDKLEGKGKTKFAEKGFGKFGDKGLGKFGDKGAGKFDGKFSLPADGPVRPTRGAYDCPLRFVGGTFYPAERVKRAMAMLAKKSKDERVEVNATDTDEVSITPAIAQAKSNVAGAGTFGFLAIIPAFWFAAEEGLVFGPIGAGVGLALGSVIAMAKIRQAAHENRMTAAEKLFEKLWCMSNANTCDGKPCFAKCTDSDGNLALVPYEKASTSKLQCNVK